MAKHDPKKDATKMVAAALKKTGSKHKSAHKSDHRRMGKK